MKEGDHQTYRRWIDRAGSDILKHVNGIISVVIRAFYKIMRKSLVFILVLLLHMVDFCPEGGRVHIQLPWSYEFCQGCGPGW